MQAWTMVDIETSGLDVGYHEVIEAAFVGHDGKEFEFSITFDESKAHPRAMEVNRMGKRHMAPLVPHVEALRLVKEHFDPTLPENVVMSSDDYPYIVAWPAQFDVAHLNAWFIRHGVPSPWHYRHVIDVRSFASGIWGLDCDLTDEWAQRTFDIRRQDYPEHTALGDARFQAAIFRKILDEAASTRYHGS